MGTKTPEIVQRILTIVIAVPLLLGIIFYTGGWGIPVLIAAASGVSGWEYCGMTQAESRRLGRMIAASTSVVLSVVMYGALEFFPAVLSATIIFIYLVHLASFEDRAQVGRDIHSTLTGMLFGGVLLPTLGLLTVESGQTGPEWFLLALLIVWCSDTAAYLGGKAMGSRDLAPQVSPNKSVEGAVFGLVGSLVAGFALNEIYVFTAGAWSHMSIGQTLLLVVPANLFGQLGDLAESLIKRSYDVKDSGVIIYGHGGLLDRIDGLMFAAPWIYIYQLLLF